MTNNNIMKLTLSEKVPLRNMVFTIIVLNSHPSVL